jgi:archaellum biogenesis ATPase FlaH
MQFKYWDEVWDEEAEFRNKIDPKKICTFGIKPLDDVLMGILKNDLVVIGADSGVGKSELGLNLALTNCEAGKTVALYFIEGGAQEAIARIKWRAVSRLYFEKYACGMDMDIRKWRMNMSDNPELMQKIEKEAFNLLVDKIGDRLHIYDFEKGFTISDLTTSLGWFCPKESFLNNPDQASLDVDLIVIDHLQYFTLSSAKNEYTEMTDILTKVKDITNHDNVPVILISHLRKKDKDRGLPSQEDFYGTSNIAKISSVSITIAPSSDGDNHTLGLYPTYFRIVKSRTGARSSLAMLCNFDSRKGEYEKVYSVCTLLYDKPHKQLAGHELPKWARNDRKTNESRTYTERRDESDLDNRLVLNGKQPGGSSVDPSKINWSE